MKHLFIVFNENGGRRAFHRYISWCKNSSCLRSGNHLKQSQEFYGADGPDQHCLEDKGLFTFYPEIFSNEERYNWPAIKPKWEQNWDPTKDVMVANCAIHCMTFDMTERVFPDAYYILATRNPYAFAESKYRSCRGRFSYAQIARHWRNETYLKRQFMKKKLGSNKVLNLTYEILCEQTDLVKKIIKEWIPELSDISFGGATHNTRHLVENSVEKLRNMNEENISRLSKKNIEELNSILKNHENLMNAHGYEIIQR